jgi:methylated-DNA-[protein]-cysteine S-methyltransferase
MTHCYRHLDSPVGKLTLVAHDSSLVAVMWEHEILDKKGFHAAKLSASHAVLNAAAKQLGEYFNKKRTRFELPLAFSGTEFQMKVWRGLQQIPYGQTWSYGQLANTVGSPKAYRAAGAANGRNPLAIVIPCHRVIGANGSMTGFGGGIKNKSILLHLESMNHE